MNQESLIAIFGSLITLALAVNAHFIKSLWESILEVKTYVNTVDRTVAVHTAELAHLTARISGAEADIRLQREGIHDLRTEFGNRIQVIELQQEKVL